jgi:nucleotide-binding universal stress UspA family protein
MENPLIGGYTHPDFPLKKEHAQMLVDARNNLSSLACEDATARGIVTEVTVVEAREVAKTIRQAAERFGADVICVGAHNRSGLSQAFVGSVARAVMVQSGRPVLVVHEQQP